MPPRFAYWTIIVEGKPTAFRAQDRDELVPTFKQLQSKHPDAVMMWFARGRLWPSPEDARAAERPSGAERRNKEWRPGGEHRDPRARFEILATRSAGVLPNGCGAMRARDPVSRNRRDRVEAQTGFHARRGKSIGAVSGAKKPDWKKEPREPRGERQPFESRGDRPRREERGDRPSGAGRPGWKPKPPGSRGERRPFENRGDRPPREDRGFRPPRQDENRGERPWRPKKPDWKPKPPGARRPETRMEAEAARGSWAETRMEAEAARGLVARNPNGGRRHPRRGPKSEWRPKPPEARDPKSEMEAEAARGSWSKPEWRPKPPGARGPKSGGGGQGRPSGFRRADPVGAGPEAEDLVASLPAVAGAAAAR